jgi:hypothetical protein
MRDKLAAIGGGNAPFHSFKKKGVLLQQSQGGILHQLLGVFAEDGWRFGKAGLPVRE